MFRIQQQPGVQLCLSHRQGALLYWAVVLFLHFLREFILTHRQRKEVRGGGENKEQKIKA